MSESEKDVLIVMQTKTIEELSRTVSAQEQEIALLEYDIELLKK